VSKSGAALKNIDVPLGATCLGESQCAFLVWAPKAARVDVHVTAPREFMESLKSVSAGYFYGEIAGLSAGARYKYRLNGSEEFPDPASRYQPEGVHGPSEIVSDDFSWTDQNWRGLALADYVLYELHIGTFTPSGTFDGVVDRLPYLRDLGISAIEIMPVAQFPGARNWGYDGVYPFAVQASYGGPAGLKRLVDAAHAMKLAVVLDVVYNHLGPEGNYLDRYGYYFTDRYETPWGKAINFDGDDAAGVRRFVIENAIRWITDFHIDALRLDAIHAIFDRSECHILREIGAAVHRYADCRHVQVIAESNLNDASVIKPETEGGYGFDAQWNDDFHHSLHALLTKESNGYYQDFGSVGHLAKSYAEGFVYSGQFSKFRGKRHGTMSTHIPAERFVVFTQNHDQVGNRMLGERLSQLLVRDELKLAAGALILSPFVPMLFMGQEYAESAPFLYFVSHSDPNLIAAVRKGRRDEFAAFSWTGEQPDPQSESTFLLSKLKHDLRQDPEHRVIHNFYRELLRLRKEISGLRNLSKDHCSVTCLETARVIGICRRLGDEETVTVLHFAEHDADVELDIRAGVWTTLLDSSDEKWCGRGSRLPMSVKSDGRVTFSLAGKSVALLIRKS
jgi:maltooligosyltrehalose trehalohydrolase